MNLPIDYSHAPYREKYLDETKELESWFVFGSQAGAPDTVDVSGATGDWFIKVPKDVAERLIAARKVFLAAVHAELALSKTHVIESKSYDIDNPSLRIHLELPSSYSGIETFDQLASVLIYVVFGLRKFTLTGSHTPWQVTIQTPGIDISQLDRERIALYKSPGILFTYEGKNEELL